MERWEGVKEEAEARFQGTTDIDRRARGLNLPSIHSRPGIRGIILICLSWIRATVSCIFSSNGSNEVNNAHMYVKIIFC